MGFAAPISSSAPPPSDGAIRREFEVPWFGAAGICLLGLAFFADPWCTGFLHLPAGTPLRDLASFISHWMDWPWVLGVLLVAILVAQGLRNLPARRQLTALLLAGAVIGVSATLIRCVTGRTRPSAPVAQGWYGPRHEGRWLLGVRDYNAFPSGHTATVAGMAALLIVRRRRFAPAAVALTVLVAWARLAVGAHRLSDVLAAILVAAVMIQFLEKWLPGNSFTDARPSPDAGQSGDGGLGSVQTA